MDRKSKFLTSSNPIGNGESDADVSEAEVWERFREAGLLDESELRRKDREALVQRIHQLEKELHDYQYHMGLLLIEKTKWTSENEETRQTLSEAKELIKREQMTHLIVISELEKRQEDIQNALTVATERIKDLEKALCKMKIASVQLMTDKKLVESHLTDTKLEEENRSTVVDMKPKGHETCKYRLQNGCTSSITETKKRTHDEDLACQQDDMQACEQRLLKSQQLVGEGQLYLDGIENRSSKSTSLFKMKAVEEEDNINIRLQNLFAKAKELDNKEMILEKKERDLVVREKLFARETVEVQKLLDDHNLSLDFKKQDFQMELDNKRKSPEQDLNEKLEYLEKKKIEINYRENQILIREDGLQSEMEKLKDKEKEIEIKLALLKEREESIHKEHQKLKDREEQLDIDSQKLIIFKAELESLRTAINTEKQQVITDNENFKLTQLELKQEIDNCKNMKESPRKETGELNQDTKEFQREMGILDERRTSLSTELKQLNHDREAFNDWRCIEEEKLRNESLKMKVDVEQWSEEFRLKREALDKEHSDFSWELEKMEKKLQEKDDDVERRKVASQNLIKLPTFVDESNFPKLESDHDRLATGEKQIFTKRRKLEIGQFETLNINTVQKHLEDEQEKLVNDRDNFLAVAEQCKICKNCGVTISELNLIGIQSPSRTASERNIFLEEHMGGSPSIRSSGHFPLLRKCSKPASLSGEASEAKTGCETDRTKSEISVRNNIVSERLFKDQDESEVPLGIVDTVISKREGRPDISSNDVKDKIDEAASRSLSAKQRVKPSHRRRGGPKTIRKTNFDRVVVEDAKAIHVEISEEKGHQTSVRGFYADTDEESRGDSVHGDQREISTGQKQDFQFASEDEVFFSENVSAGGGHKNHQTSSPGTPITGEKRYNFRLSTM